MIFDIDFGEQATDPVANLCRSQVSPHHSTADGMSQQKTQLNADEAPMAADTAPVCVAGPTKERVREEEPSATLPQVNM